MANTFPMSIFCIIATEFCERFSFCGLRTILSLYLRNQLLVPENMATVVYHVFIMLCYLIPFVGAVFADSFLGRYRTILYFSMVYLSGNILMCFAAIPPMHLQPFCFTMIGLVLISIGTGGIKPCVAAFGGDQFCLPEQEDRLQGFFSMFYFAINTGGLIGMLLTPTLRKSVHCFGDDSCYALGFGFPAGLMLVALCVFVSGKRWYRMKKPKENVIIKFIGCTMCALKVKLNTPENKRNKPHWLDYAEGYYETKLIEDMKIMYAIMFLYIPLPIFWSLFDQQGSRWTFQASRTNGDIHIFNTTFQILPDQMQVVNPALVLLLIPLLERIIYPNCMVLRTPLNRMILGGFLAGLAFLASGMLEFQLQENLIDFREKIGTSTLNIINTLDCNAQIECPYNVTDMLPLESLGPRQMIFNNFTVDTRKEYMCRVNIPTKCDGRNIQETETKFEDDIKELQMFTVLIGLTVNNSVQLHQINSTNGTRSLSGKPKFRVVYLHTTPVGFGPIFNMIDFRNISELKIIFNPARDANRLLQSGYQELSPGNYFYEMYHKDIYANGTILLEMGAVYTLVLREYQNIIEFQKLFTISQPHSTHMLWLLPQYILISFGEIMFAISGLEFSFTQAPKSMKTIIIAAWYLTVAFGNFLVILITQARIVKSQANEFFMFAVLIFVDMLIFFMMCRKYENVPLEGDGSSSYFRRESQPLLILNSEEQLDN